MARVLIAPSILAADFTRLREQIQAAEAGGADWLHLDVMDGHFVPNISFGPGIVEKVRSCTSLPLDVHLMIMDPLRYIADFRKAGADMITVHQETSPHLNRTVAHIRESGARAGVCVNPATPTALLSDIVSEVDLILIMSVNPGFGGQKFIPSALGKIREARAMASAARRDVYIEVDGGIGPENAGSVVEAGATVLVAGTSVFRQPDIGTAIAGLRTATALKA